MNLLKYKKTLLVASAIVVIALLLLIKNVNSVIAFLEKHFPKKEQATGLSYDSNTTVGDLINKDTDGDGIPDWEERLWGTDPTKAETVPGVPDSVTIEKLKAAELAQNGQTVDETGGPVSTNLTQTDQFAREFVATISTLNENGTMDQATIDKISSTLEDNIQNTPQRKIYILTDIKITSDNSVEAVQKYGDALDSLKPKTPVSYTVLDVLNKFSPDDNDIDPTVLTELGPLITQTNNTITGMLKTEVPQYLSSMHLDVINSLELLSENMTDMQSYDTDPIVALVGITKYSQDTADMTSAVQKLTDAINQKLEN